MRKFKLQLIEIFETISRCGFLCGIFFYCPFWMYCIYNLLQQGDLATVWQHQRRIAASSRLRMKGTNPWQAPWSYEKSYSWTCLQKSSARAYMKLGYTAGNPPRRSGKHSSIERQGFVSPLNTEKRDWTSGQESCSQTRRHSGPVIMARCAYGGGTTQGNWYSFARGDEIMNRW